MEPLAGRRRRRRTRHRRERPPCPGEPKPQEPSTLREVAAAEILSKKTCHTSSSTLSAMSGPHVWADLLDNLIHQIIALLSSFHDLLAFIGTCHSWRAALASLPPAFSFNFPPLHLRPDTGYPHPHRNYAKYNLLSNLKWQLIDPAKRTSTRRCSVPRSLRDRMRYLGCSCGYLIFSNVEHCVLVDVYSGTVVRPPKFKPGGNNQIYYGILVPALNSPNAQLLLCSRSTIFQWQIGTHSWLEHPLDGERILQIVFFKGEIFAMDYLQRLHRIRLAPQLSVQEVATIWGEDMVVGLKFKPWLVVCSDVFLLVDLSVSMDALSGFSGTFEVFHLDLSVEPAKWVKVENLGNNALFVSFDRRNLTFYCMNPERWGGKSNCIYVANLFEDSDEVWTVVELGQVVPTTMLCTTHSNQPIEVYQPQNVWVLPSFVYGIGH